MLKFVNFTTASMLSIEQFQDWLRFPTSNLKGDTSNTQKLSRTFLISAVFDCLSMRFVKHSRSVIMST